MSEENDTPEKEPLAQEPPKPVTVEMFHAVDFEAALADSSKVEPHDLCSQCSKLAREAAERQEHDAERVFGLLSGACGIHLRAEDRAEPWGPMAQFDGRRTPIPADYKGEQSAAFVAIIDRIKESWFACASCRHRVDE